MTGQFSREDLRELGRCLRGLREGRRWSLKRLSAESGISTAAIRKIESGEANANLLTVLALIESLGETIDTVVEAAHARRTVQVTRAGGTAGEVDLSDRLEGPAMRGAVAVVRRRNAAANEDNAPFFCFVLEGSARITLDDGADVVLEAGDCLHSVRPALRAEGHGNDNTRILQVSEVRP